MSIFDFIGSCELCGEDGVLVGHSKITFSIARNVIMIGLLFNEALPRWQRLVFCILPNFCFAYFSSADSYAIDYLSLRFCPVSFKGADKDATLGL